MKFNENHSKGSRDMVWTQNSRVNPLTLSLGSWAMCSAHCLSERNIGSTFESSLMKIVQRILEICSGHKMKGKSHYLDV